MNVTYRLEHTGYMVADPVAIAAWYCKHLGFQVQRCLENSPFTQFVTDASGEGMIEIYNNPKAEVPDYASVDPLVLHLGFMVNDIDTTRESLLAAGATLAGGLIETAAGDRLQMLRDPWGMAIQLCQRKTPMVGCNAHSSR